MTRSLHELSPEELAAALPIKEDQGRVSQALLSAFCVGMLVVSLLMPIRLEGLVGGLLIDGSSVVVYLLLRWLTKRSGILSFGSFVIDSQGVLRVLSGVAAARRQARGMGDVHRWFIREVLLGLAMVPLILGVPVAIAIWLDRPQVMLGWMVCFGLAMAELPLLVWRIHWARRQGARVLQPGLPMGLTAGYLHRGGDPRQLTSGIPLRELIPQSREEADHISEVAMTVAVTSAVIND